MGDVCELNFLEVYEMSIAPKLREIDLFLKEADYPLSTSDVARVLGIDSANLAQIMAKLSISEIGQSDFIEIMKKGDSQICRLFCREVELGSPPTYTVNQIAYIYNLDQNAVYKACQKLQIREATPYIMPMIFAQIPIGA